MALMPGRGGAAANLADPSTRAYLPGAAGEVASIPGALSYRRIRNLRRNRIHPRDRKRWIFIPLLLGNRGGQFPRGTGNYSIIRSPGRGPALIPQRHPVLARLRAADQDAAVAVDPDRL